ncbi:MAG: hypothetical protein JW809_18185 [Pirellulales bacterium]|nr:hypothetical protein [Pirellulales bacterium]
MVDLAVSVSKGWMARVLGPVFDRDYYFDPRRRHEIDTQCGEYVQAELADLGACFTESNLGRREYLAPNQVLVGGIQPNMILGMILGAQLIPGGDKDADITPQCLLGRRVDDLPEPESLPEHELVRLWDNQLATIRRAGHPRPIPPFFWDTSGRPAVHGALTSAQKFLGEQVFVDLLTDPELGCGLLRWISRANVALVRHFADYSHMPITEIHVGECAACMVGAKLFRQCVLPELMWMRENLAPVRLHTCGASGHLVEAIAEGMPLASLDLGGDNSLARVRAQLGPTLPITIAPLATDLSDADPKALLKWTDLAIQENAGGPLGIVCHLEPSYRLASLRAMRDRVQRWGYV